MSEERSKQGITYEKEVIFRMVALLHFALQDLVPSFGALPGEEPDSDEYDDIEPPSSPPQGECKVVIGPPTSPMVFFGDAYEDLCGGLFDQYLEQYDALSEPILADPDLRKEFERFVLEKFDHPIMLEAPRPTMKKRPRFTVITGGAGKKDPPKA